MIIVSKLFKTSNYETVTLNITSVLTFSLASWLKN